MIDKLISNYNQNMKKIIFSFIIMSCLFSQTGIITSKGFQSIGLWGKIHRPFTDGDNISYDFQLEYYSSIGLEISIGTFQKEDIDPWNRLAVAHHFRFDQFGLKFEYVKSKYDNYDFFESEGFSQEENSITFFNTGRQLNPFLKFYQKN